MTKQNKTKNALILSTLSLVLCLAMLVGSTFAWFTDSATTAVNVIQAGTIDLRLTDLDGNNMEGKTLNWVDANGGTDVLWEPGATIFTEPVRLWNYSNLSIMIDFAVTGFAGDLKLLEAIEYKLVQDADMRDDNGNLLPYDQIDEAPLSKGALQADWFGLQADWGEDIVEGENVIPVGVGDPKPLSDLRVIAHMKEDAGNEYQGLKLVGASITVIAKQMAFDNDSYGNTYDENAEWPIIIGSKDQLLEELAKDDVKKVTIVGGQFDEKVVIPSGKSVTSENGRFIPNGKYDIPVSVESDSELVLNGGTYMSGSANAQVIDAQSGGSKVTVNDGEYYGGVAVWAASTSEVVINGGTFNTWALAVHDNDNYPVIVNGGTFNLGKGGIDAGTGCKITINGGTFNVDPTKWLGEGKTAIDNGNGTWTVQ